MWLYYKVARDTINKMTFYLFRHGQTFFSKFKIPYGPMVLTASINREGKMQAKQIAQDLKKEEVKIIYSSPLKRCTQTVEIIKGEITNLKIILDPRLEEEKTTRGLETFEEFTQRLNNIVSEIKSQNIEKVGICTHGWPLAAIIAILKKGKVEKSDLAQYPSCGALIKI